MSSGGIDARITESIEGPGKRLANSFFRPSQLVADLPEPEPQLQAQGENLANVIRKPSDLRADRDGSLNVDEIVESGVLGRRVLITGKNRANRDLAGNVAA